jgi:branched-chain amino acid transport system ATP-binding protein
VTATAPMLSVEGLDVAYGDFQVLWQAAMHVGEREIVAILGPNGAGKSTLMNSISGLIGPRAGRITFLGKRIDGLPAHRTAAEGLAHVLERRRLFPFLSVRDNLLLGAHNPAARPHRAETLAALEQQMVAIARGLMSRPRLLMIDEPFLGLSPLVVQQTGALMQRIREEQGISIVFIEQNVELALRLADRGYILESGRTILTGTSAELLRSAEVKRIFLGDVAL